MCPSCTSLRHCALRMHSTCLTLLLCLDNLFLGLSAGSSVCALPLIFHSFIHPSTSSHFLRFSQSMKGLQVSPRCDLGIRLALYRAQYKGQRSKVIGPWFISHALGRPIPLTPSMALLHVCWYYGPSTKGIFLVYT